MFHNGIYFGHNLQRLFYVTLNSRQKCLFMSTSAQTSVTLETIFSPVNKQRVQKSLLKVRPVKKSGVASKVAPQASVLVPLCTVNGQPSVLFTLRSSRLTSHSGHVSFPGGKMDDSDRDVIHTALRETEEELGLSDSIVDVWGTLLPSPSRNGMSVTPVLGYCGNLDVDILSPNPTEVEAVFTRTISSLCDPNNIRSTHFKSGSGYTLPVFLGGEHRIWGLSAVILHQTLTVLAPGLYNFNIRIKR